MKEDGEAAPMEGVESAAEQLVKPAAQEKIATKPAARRAATKVCMLRHNSRYHVA